MSKPDTVRFRHNQAILVAAVIAFIGALPLATARWYLLPVLLVPLAVARLGLAGRHRRRRRGSCGYGRWPGNAGSPGTRSSSWPPTSAGARSPGSTTASR